MPALRIAMLAPFEETVPPVKYGGTERVVASLTEELVRRGHQVTLFSVKGTNTSAKLFELFEAPLRLYEPTSHDTAKREAYKFIGVARILEALQEQKFDIVHNHISWRFIPYHKLAHAPVVTTIHHPLAEDTIKQRHVQMLYKDLPYVSISLSQRTPAPELNYVGNVYNGIKVETFSIEEHPQDYLAFLGRMSPEKGPIEAIRLARQAGKKLLMAAKIDEGDRKFFHDQVEPLVDGEQIVYIGEVDHQGKVDLLSNAQALLAPIQWDEPFGLYFIEAMACGTPVLTFRRGSASELIEHGKTGFIADNMAEIYAYVKEIQRLDRTYIHQYAVDRFSIDQMASGYEEIYKKVIAAFNKKLDTGI